MNKAQEKLLILIAKETHKEFSKWECGMDNEFHHWNELFVSVQKMIEKEIGEVIAWNKGKPIISK